MCACAECCDCCWSPFLYFRCPDVASRRIYSTILCVVSSLYFHKLSLLPFLWIWSLPFFQSLGTLSYCHNCSKVIVFCLAMIVVTFSHPMNFWMISLMRWCLILLNCLFAFVYFDSIFTFCSCLFHNSSFLFFFPFWKELVAWGCARRLVK